VAERIATFREKHPDGSLQQVSLDFQVINNRSWVIYTAAAYRSPDDERPGIGTAWEPVPGATNFTRDSEVQNAETAAWGRAIVAALAGDTKRSIASAEEVRNRQAQPEPTPKDTKRDAVLTFAKANYNSPEDFASDFAFHADGAKVASATEEQLDAFLTAKGAA
jgi:hypothetical protein